MTFVLEGITVAAVLGLVAQGAAMRGRWRLQERRLQELERRGSLPRLGSGECFEISGHADPTDRIATLALTSLPSSLQASADAFSQRLEHASHNLLQSVEGMRAAADGLCRGTAGLETCYARLETMYARFEPIAHRMADSRAMQEKQVSEMSAGLFGITQSLTTVVASANQSQAAVGQVAISVAEAVAAVQAAATGLERSVDRLAAAWQETRGAGREAAAPASLRESVTLRLMVEQQQQFINLLDQRLCRPERSAPPPAGPDRGYSSSSSSSSSSSCSSSSMPSSSAAKLPPARALSNHSM